MTLSHVERNTNPCGPGRNQHPLWGSRHQEDSNSTSSNCRLSFVQSDLGHVPVLAGCRPTSIRVQKFARRFRL